MVASAGRYLRLLSHLGRYTLNRELSLRGNFLVKISVEVLWLAIMVAFYRTVFARTSTVANWSEPDYFFFVGCYFALNGLTRPSSWKTATISPSWFAPATSTSCF